MLGSLTFYRRILKDNVYNNPTFSAITRDSFRQIEIEQSNLDRNLPAAGHGLAGMMAGFTVSFIAAPVEHIKARLQIQYAAEKSQRLYKGPIDCFRKIVCHPSP